jgi:lambda family phage portal protein
VSNRISSEFRLSWWDKILIGIAPKWGVERVKARAMVRHYEAAIPGRRTSSWRRPNGDADASNVPSLPVLRELTRDLRRNNGWASRGIETIANNSIGWGIKPTPKATERSRARAEAAIDLWNEWADSTKCDYDGQLNFYGLQRLVMTTVVESGEALVLRQPAAMKDGLPVPVRIQVLEPEYLDMTRTGLFNEDGSRIIDGIEFDGQGRRIAYWLYTSSPVSRIPMKQIASVRVPAERVLHVYRVDRAGQTRGVPWFATAIAKLKDLDVFEDAELVQQQVAACFGAFVTDMEGGTTAISEEDEEDNELEKLQPGHISYLAPGEDVRFAQPPPQNNGALPERVLRRIAAGLNVTFEDLTGDYSKVNFSSARMARIAHWAHVWVWREHMVIPQLCAGVWGWVMQLAQAFESWPSIPGADWYGPPMPILELDKEATAYQRALRIGMITWPQMIREQGNDPVAQLKEIADTNEKLDEAGVILDMDPRFTTSAGQKQQAASSSASSSADAANAGGDAADESAAEDATEPNEADDAAASDGTDPSSTTGG